MEDCIFCQIAAGEIPSQIVYKDEDVIAFRDIKPIAPTHILVIPKKHIRSLRYLTKADESLMGHVIMVANNLADQEGIAKGGYRLVISSGRQGGQMVPHIHLHLLGGRQLSGALG